MHVMFKDVINVRRLSFDTTPDHLSTGGQRNSKDKIIYSLGVTINGGIITRTTTVKCHECIIVFEGENTKVIHGAMVK